MLLAPAFSIDAVPDIPIGVAFNVTVSSGTVGSDLTDFPLMIDLGHMPAGFWSAVRSDGGNVRAYESDGSTILPHDLTFIDTDRELGRLFVKKTILSASDTTVQVKVLTTAHVTLAVTEPAGRNAVWSDYESVWVFPSVENRTGVAHTQDTTGLEDYTPWVRQDYYGALAGDPHQGIATDGSGTFVTIDTNDLRKYTGDDLSTVVASNSDPVGDVITATGNANLNHLSDGCVIAGELWVPCNEYPVSGGHDEFLVVFNLSDLTVNRYYDVSAKGRHISGVAYNSAESLIYAVDYNDGSSFVRFNLSGVAQSDVAAATTVDLIQGIEIVEGKILVNSSDENLYEFELDGAYNGIVHHDPHTGIGEGLCYDGELLYLLEGDGDLSVVKKDDDHFDWTKSHYDRASIDVPRSTIWTAATSVFWTVTDGDTQSQFLDIVTDTSNTGTGLMYDDGPDVVGMWNNTDSWLHSTTNPGYKDTFRVAFAHNGTTERKVHVDGTAWKDSGVSARAGGSDTNMSLLLGSDDGEGYFQHTWLRGEYMSDDWMAADADNMNSPATFYTVASVV